MKGNQHLKSPWKLCSPSVMLVNRKLATQIILAMLVWGWAWQFPGCLAAPVLNASARSSTRSSQIVKRDMNDTNKQTRLRLSINVLTTRLAKAADGHDASITLVLLGVELRSMKAERMALM
eukprot:4322916-Amphidinium_carterae.2